MRTLPATALLAAVSLGVWGQQPQAAHGLPARGGPADYQAHAKVNDKLSIGAEFTGHGIPTETDPLNSEEYVAVEVALFGPEGARAAITPSDFTLKINGKSLPAQPYGLVAKGIKDPTWAPPEPPGGSEPKSKGGISGNAGGNRPIGEPPPLPPPVPIDLLRGWQQRVSKAAIQEGDRALPQAGLIFFLYRGKTDSIKTVELQYKGAAGSANLKLQ